MKIIIDTDFLSDEGLSGLVNFLQEEGIHFDYEHTPQRVCLHRHTKYVREDELDVVEFCTDCNRYIRVRKTM
jgi:hypothetical protein